MEFEIINKMIRIFGTFKKKIKSTTLKIGLITNQLYNNRNNH